MTTLNGNNFKVLNKEIRRQYNIQMKVDNSHDTKIGIMLGFIIVVLSQIISSRQIIDLVSQNMVSSMVFGLGFLSIIYAGYCGIRAYLIRKYKLGPKLDQLVEQYRQGEKRNYVQVVSRKIYDAFIENSEISENKAKYINKMFISFFTGFLIIVLSTIVMMAIHLPNILGKVF